MNFVLMVGEWGILEACETQESTTGTNHMPVNSQAMFQCSTGDLRELCFGICNLGPGICKDGL